MVKLGRHCDRPLSQFHREQTVTGGSGEVRGELQREIVHRREEQQRFGRCPTGTGVADRPCFGFQRRVSTARTSARCRQAQHEDLDEWVRLLRRFHPQLDPTPARIRVHAVLSTINTIARTPHLRRNPGTPTALAQVSDRMLELPPG